MDAEQLKERIDSYLTRSVPKYNLNEEGVFRVTGAEYGDLSQDHFYTIPHNELGFVKGRFIDVIAYALDIPQFYYEWDKENPVNENAGYITKIEVKDAPVLEGLLE